MRTSAIVCALLAGSLGLGTATSAFAGRNDRDDRREARKERREERRELRHERREDRREARHDRREDRREWRRHQQQHRWAAQSHPQPRHYQAPRYVVQQPQYVYSQPRYVYSQPARFHRGGYLPYEYRQPVYYVNDWQAVHGLYAPPSGHQWMHVGNEYLLVAIATGLIAGLLSGM